MVGDQKGRSVQLASKLLFYLLVISSFAFALSFAEVVHPCLANGLFIHPDPIQEPRATDFIFEVNSFNSYFRELKSRRLRLRSDGTQWILTFDPENMDASKLARDEYLLVWDRPTRLSSDQPGLVRNRILLKDWILSFDPWTITTRQGGRMLQPTSPKHNPEFIVAWNEFRIRFANQFMQYQDQLNAPQGRNRPVAAEADFLADTVITALHSIFTDPAAREERKQILFELAEKFNHSYEYDFTRDPIDLSLILFGKVWQYQAYGKIKLTPLYDSHNLSLQHELPPWESLVSNSNGISFGKGNFSLPLMGLDIEVKDLRLESRVEPTSAVASISNAQIAPSFKSFRVDDGLKLHFVSDGKHDLHFSPNFVYSYGQDTDLLGMDFSRSSFGSGLDGLELKTIELHGVTYDPSSASFATDIRDPLLFEFFRNLLNGNQLVQTSLENLPVLIKSYYPEPFAFVQTFVLMKDGKIAIFDNQSKETDPQQNNQIIASFDLRVPLEFEAVAIQPDSVNPSVHLANFAPHSSPNQSIRPQIQLGTKILPIELKNLVFYDDGRILFSTPIEARLQLGHKRASSTTASAVVPITMGPPFHMSSEGVKTNLEDVMITDFEYRLGDGPWKTSVRANPLNLLLQNLSFIQKQLPTTAEASPSPLQTELEAIIRDQLLSGIRDTIDKDKNMDLKGISIHGEGIWSSLTGTIHQGRAEIENLSVKDAEVHLKKIEPANRSDKAGTYWASADVTLLFGPALKVRAENLEMELDGKDHDLSNLKANSVSGLIESKKGDKSFQLQLTANVYLSANRKDLNLSLENFSTNLDEISLTHTLAENIRTDSKWLEGFSEYLNLETGSNLQELVNQILTTTISRKLCDALKSNLAPYFQKEIPKILASEELHSKIKTKLAALNAEETQIDDKMGNFGASIQAVVEGYLSEWLSTYLHQQENLINSWISGRSNFLTSLMAPVWSAIGGYFEDAEYGYLVDQIYGPSSRRALSVHFSQILDPGYLQTKVSALAKERLPRPKNPALFANLLVENLDPCPFVDPVRSEQKFRTALKAHLTELNAVQIRALDTLVKDRCYRPVLRVSLANENAVNGSNGLTTSVLSSFNDLLQKQLVRHLLAIKTPTQVPILASAGREIDPEWQVSGFRMTNVGLPMPVFQLLFYSKKLFNKRGLEGPPDPIVVDELKKHPDGVVLRVLREGINQILLQIDWEKLLKVQFPYYFRDPWHVNVAQAPEFNEKGQIEMAMSYRDHLLFSPAIKVIQQMLFENSNRKQLDQILEPRNLLVNAGSFAALVVSLSDLEDISGIDASTALTISLEPVPLDGSRSGSEALLHFGSIRIDQLRSSEFLSFPIKNTLSRGTGVLNGFADRIFSQSGYISSFEIAGNRFDLVERPKFSEGKVYVLPSGHRMTTQGGDLYMVYRRSDATKTLAYDGHSE